MTTIDFTTELFCRGMAWRLMRMVPSIFISRLTALYFQRRSSHEH